MKGMVNMDLNIVNPENVIEEFVHSRELPDRRKGRASHLTPLLFLYKRLLSPLCIHVQLHRGIHLLGIRKISMSDTGIAFVTHIPIFHKYTFPTTPCYLATKGFLQEIKKGILTFSIVLFFITITAFSTRADEQKKFTLNDCIKFTLENNPQLKASAMDVMSSQGNYGIARSVLLPQINAVANAQRATSNLVITSKSPYASLYYKQPDNTNYPYYTASITLTQQLFSFGKNYFGMRSSSELIDAATYNLKNTRNTLIYNVKQNFYNLLQYNMIIDSDKYLLKQMETQLQQAESYYKAGLKTKIDVLSARTSLGNIKLSLITAENARKIYILNLLSLMGLPLTSDISFEGTLEATPVTFDTSLYVKKALENRPDYLSLKKQLDSARYSYKQSISSYFPTLSGNASYNWAGQDFPLVWNWAIGLELDFNIFSGFETTSALQVARAQMLKIKYAIEQQKLAVELSVQSALDNVEQAQKSINVAKDTLSEAEANLQLTEKGYSAGLNNYLDYLTAVANYQNAEASYATALASYNLAVANLEYVTGYEIENGGNDEN